MLSLGDVTPAQRQLSAREGSLLEKARGSPRGGVGMSGCDLLSA